MHANGAVRHREGSSLACLTLHILLHAPALRLSIRGLGHRRGKFWSMQVITLGQHGKVNGGQLGSLDSARGSSGHVPQVAGMAPIGSGSAPLAQTSNDFDEVHVCLDASPTLFLNLPYIFILYALPSSTSDTSAAVLMKYMSAKVFSVLTSLACLPCKVCMSPGVSLTWASVQDSS